MSEMMPGTVGHSVLSIPRSALGAVLSRDAGRLMGRLAVLPAAWASIVNRSLNMFTLIGIGTGTAYAYSLVADLYPAMFPAGFRDHGAYVTVYFEAAAVITTLVLLGQVLELRAAARPERQSRRCSAWRRRPRGSFDETERRGRAARARARRRQAAGPAR